MLRAEIVKEFKVPDGECIIRTPGMFEGEPIWVPYYYNFMMEGFGEMEMDCGSCDLQHLPDGSEECSSCDNYTTYHNFPIEDDDIREFPELKDDLGKTIRLWVSDQGFVYSEITK